MYTLWSKRTRGF